MSASERFAIPLASVRETLRVAEHPIFRSEDKELLNLRGLPLALRRLADEFGAAGCGAGARVSSSSCSEWASSGWVSSSTDSTGSRTS